MSFINIRMIGGSTHLLLKNFSVTGLQISLVGEVVFFIIYIYIYIYNILSLLVLRATSVTKDL